ncbi:hypothetical protein T492DRAFT_856117 [Pavlovales sp. CCMP2436]|nr:hypothetical protein T492DRAFT_856117 [Pavlovales sp. CCMP2436]
MARKKPLRASSSDYIFKYAALGAAPRSGQNRFGEDSLSPVADERAPRTPAADEPAPRARAAFDESARVDIDMTADDEDEPVTIKWSYQTHLPRFARLFAERHGEADPTRLKATEIRSLALAMELTDLAAGISTIKRQLKVLKDKGVAAIIEEAAITAKVAAAAHTVGGRGRTGPGAGASVLQEPRQARP